MFNIGSGEIVVIAIVALLVLGPKRLPELARGIGKFLREFRRQTDEVRNVVEREFYKMDEEGSLHDKPPAILPAAGALGRPNRPLEPARLGPPMKPALPPTVAVPASAAPVAQSASPETVAPAEVTAADALPTPEPVRSQTTAGLDPSPVKPDPHG